MDERLDLAWDLCGRLLSSTERRTGEAAPVRVTTFLYYPDGRLEREVNDPGGAGTHVAEVTYSWSAEKTLVTRTGPGRTDTYFRDCAASRTAATSAATGGRSTGSVDRWSHATSPRRSRTASPPSWYRSLPSRSIRRPPQSSRT